MKEAKTVESAPVYFKTNEEIYKRYKFGTNSKERDDKFSLKNMIYKVK